MTSEIANSATKPRHFSGWHVLGFVLLAMVIAVVATVWVIRSYIFPSDFKPVTLNSKEHQVLTEKLDRFEGFGIAAAAAGSKKANNDDPEAPLEPERYSEQGADRSITFTEREVNGLLANNTDLARKLAIDLSEDLVSAKLLVPVDEDFPIFGGQVLKVRAGMELAHRDGKPIVVLRGISIMGVPLPNV
ncbi:MAG: arginine N-succinyltransferase, partial [Gammaproteobacteria bacterium]|nr:arginine N-succinyltransferase [Gammaproteobacteria bacterium]